MFLYIQIVEFEEYYEVQFHTSDKLQYFKQAFYNFDYDDKILYRNFIILFKLSYQFNSK